MRISDWSSDVCSSDLPDALGEARVFHTNAWPGVRRTGQGGGHWTGDTSADAARAYFSHIKERLGGEGWAFAVGKTKILMLSHSALAREQSSEEHTSELQSLMRISYAAFCRKQTHTNIPLRLHYQYNS